MVARNSDGCRNPNEMMIRELAATLSVVSFAKACGGDSCSVRRDSHLVCVLNYARCFDLPTQICGGLPLFEVFRRHVAKELSNRVFCGDAV